MPTVNEFPEFKVENRGPSQTTTMEKLAITFGVELSEPFQLQNLAGDLLNNGDEFFFTPSDMRAANDTYTDQDIADILYLLLSEQIFIKHYTTRQELGETYWYWWFGETNPEVRPKVCYNDNLDAFLGATAKLFANQNAAIAELDRLLRRQTIQERIDKREVH